MKLQFTFKAESMVNRLLILKIDLKKITQPPSFPELYPLPCCAHNVLLNALLN